MQQATGSRRQISDTPSTRGFRIPNPLAAIQETCPLKACSPLLLADQQRESRSTRFPGRRSISTPTSERPTSSESTTARTSCGRWQELQDKKFPTGSKRKSALRSVSVSKRSCLCPGAPKKRNLLAPASGGGSREFAASQRRQITSKPFSFQIQRCSYEQLPNGASVRDSTPNLILNQALRAIPTISVSRGKHAFGGDRL